MRIFNFEIRLIFFQTYFTSYGNKFSLPIGYIDRRKDPETHRAGGRQLSSLILSHTVPTWLTVKGISLNGACGNLFMASF